MDIDFEPVREGAAEALIALFRACHDEDGQVLSVRFEAAVREIAQAQAQAEPLARAWFIRHGGKSVGYVVVTVGYSVEYGGRDGFIDDVYLIPEARGRGWGRQVIDFAVAEAARLGIRTLHLEVELNNDRAHALYQSAGFEETGRRLMRRRLQP